jgi:hypothetical protein
MRQETESLKHENRLADTIASRTSIVSRRLHDCDLVVINWHILCGMVVLFQEQPLSSSSSSSSRRRREKFTERGGCIRGTSCWLMMMLLLCFIKQAGFSVLSMMMSRNKKTPLLLLARTTSFFFTFGCFPLSLAASPVSNRTVKKSLRSSPNFTNEKIPASLSLTHGRSRFQIQPHS